MLKLQIIFIGLCMAVVGAFSGPPASAQIGNRQSAEPLPFQDCPEDSTFGCFEVGLPGISKDQPIDQFLSENEGRPILAFINLAVNAVIAVLVIIGLITIVIAGYIYMTAGGMGSQVTLAKQMIQAALVGIFLSLVSVIILNTINKYIGSEAFPYG